jgi:predicted dehydrogenase
VKNKIRVGVVGVGRGKTFMRPAEPVGMELVAICDTWEDRLNRVSDDLGVAAYTDFREFLTHDMDAVVLANYFHEHTPFAIEALHAGKHVMSECAACHTLGEGVALCEAVEETGLIYMFAENYPYSAVNQEMRRLFREGEIGDFRYGEGEYVHPDPARVKLARSCGKNHWRNWIPATYYCTHSLAPVMAITDTRPVKVNAFVVPYDFNDPTQIMGMKSFDTGCVIVYRMDNDAVVKCIHGQFRGHGNFVRIHGNRGLMEGCRHGDRGRLRLWHDKWECPEGTPQEQVYKPDFPVAKELAEKAGHGGGDFFTCYHFAEAIRSGRQPFLDVYRGVTMSIAGVQAWRSTLNDSCALPVPDFRDKAAREEYRHDDWSPDPLRDNEHRFPCSVLGEIPHTPEAEAYARKIWAEQGYTGE